MSGYFDFDDYETPIKTYVEDSISIEMVKNKLTSELIDVRRDQVELSDNIFYNAGFTKKEYYSISDQNQMSFEIDSTSNQIIVVNFRLSKTSLHYERVVYSFLDMFGFLGGLFDFLLFIGYIFISNFQDKYFQNEIISKIYQVEVDKDHAENAHKIFAKGKTFDSSKISKKMNSSTSNLNDDSKNDIDEIKSQNDLATSQKCLESNVSEEGFTHAFDVIKNRRMYSYKWHNLIPSRQV